MCRSPSLSTPWAVSTSPSTRPPRTPGNATPAGRAKEPRVYDSAAARLPTIDDFDGDDPTHDRWVLARHTLPARM
ncbi:hypothetical protein ACFQ3Z_44295 [Streptomyces nogalater]